MDEPHLVEYAALAFLFPVALTGFWMFDRLVRLEYASYRDQWEGDGRPHGLFWLPR